MSVELLELAADALGDLLNQVAFVGGATVTLRITDLGAPPARPTKDVDVVVEVTTRTAFAEFEGRLRARDFDDIIALVDGREEVIDEVTNASAYLRDYLSSEVAALLRDPRFDDGLFAVLRPDAGSQARAERVILPRLHAIRDADPGRNALAE